MQNSISTKTLEQLEEHIILPFNKGEKYGERKTTYNPDFEHANKKLKDIPNHVLVEFVRKIQNQLDQRRSVDSSLMIHFEAARAYLDKKIPTWRPQE